MSHQRAVLTADTIPSYVGQVILVARTCGDGDEPVHPPVDLILEAAERQINHLGGVWHDVTLRYPDRVVVADSRHLFMQGPAYVEHRWCSRCHARVEVTETFDDSDFDTGGEVGYAVTRLDCGHETARETGVVSADPTQGAAAPYAGPHRAVAATSRPADRRAADRRQAAINDPWGPA